MTKVRPMRFLIFFTLLLPACTVSPHKSAPLQLQGKVLIAEDTIWQGEVRIDGEVTVAHGVVLRILPGAQVGFVYRDTDRDGLGDATIIVKGSLLANGTENEPILFHSTRQNPAPGDWLEIRSDFARRLEFDWCEFRDSAYTLHAHFTRGYLRNSHLHHNIDGSRLGRSKFLVEHNLIEQNIGKGINFRDSAVTLRANILRDNRVGVFLFEKPGTSVITGNNLYRNDQNLQLGDFFVEDIHLAGNWWGSAEQSEISASIHDRTDDPEIGQVYVAPEPAWLIDAGVQRSLRLKPLWQVESGGFVDSAPLLVGDKILFASWDGSVRALRPDGKLLWEADSGDVIDSGLLSLGGQVYLQNWQRQLLQLNLQSGRVAKLFTYPESPADDHRQGGLARAGELLLLPAWNGTLYVFTPGNPAPLWQFDAGQPLRSAPLVTGDQVIVASGSGRLSALTLAGELRWQHQLEAPLLADPVLADGSLLVLDKEGSVSRFSLKGKRLWQRRLDQLCFYAAPLVVEKGLFVATAAGELWKLDLETGAILWRQKFGWPFYASPSAVGKLLVVGDNLGRLHLIDSDSGRELSRLQVEGPIQSRALLTGNRLYFGSRDRKLHAYEVVHGGSE